MNKHAMAGAMALAVFWTGTVQAQDFSGPRIEARVGWDHASPGGRQLSADGLSYGTAAGYDLALGRTVVVGVEAGIDLFDNATDRLSGTTRYESSAEREIELAGRIGFVPADNILLYAKAGYANARFEDVVTTGGTTGNTRTEVATNLDGIRAGAGAEVNIADGLFAKTEYRYTNFANGVSRHQVLAGFGLRF